MEHFCKEERKMKVNAVWRRKDHYYYLEARSSPKTEITSDFTFPSGKFVSDTPFHPSLHPVYHSKKGGLPSFHFLAQGCF